MSGREGVTVEMKRFCRLDILISRRPCCSRPASTILQVLCSPGRSQLTTPLRIEPGIATNQAPPRAAQQLPNIRHYSIQANNASLLRPPASSCAIPWQNQTRVLLSSSIHPLHYRHLPAHHHRIARVLSTFPLDTTTLSHTHVHISLRRSTTGFA